MPKTFRNMIHSLFVLASLPLYALAGPSGCHFKGIKTFEIVSLVMSIWLMNSIADDIGQPCTFATDNDYVRAARYWCSLNASKGVTAKNQIWFPGQGNTAWLGMTDSKGRKIAMWGNLNVDKKAKGTVVLDYDMCVDLMLMIKNGNSNAISGGCGLYGGWLPYGGNSGIYNSAATSAGVFQGICVTV
ncbi:hypothetical protein IMSHALPRED_007026 [Imshaugia aleurites]|uniref:Uncharacterized protein n=1 Tax=Imshaugia aleurites TaxID=172621 RepID=A0A8H3FMW9_9LECA|nr:hypothetical protein IMSHALPRED_007026 [Imshaugia aleurites]